MRKLLPVRLEVCWPVEMAMQTSCARCRRTRMLKSVFEFDDDRGAECFVFFPT